MEVVVYLFNLYLLLLPLPSYVYLRDVYLRDVYLRECPIISALLLSWLCCQFRGPAADLSLKTAKP